MSRKHIGILFAGIIALFCALSIAHAQTDAPAPIAGITADSLVQWLTPILVPLVLAGFKKVAPSLPTWIIPVLAPVLGVLIEFINGFISNNSSNFLLAAGLGLAGVGLRELKEAVKPAPNGGWPTTE